MNKLLTNYSLHFSQQENDFVSQYLSKVYDSEVTNVWTGGLVTSMVGVDFKVWHDSKASIVFNKFYNLNGGEDSMSDGGVSLELIEGMKQLIQIIMKCFTLFNILT